MSGSDGSRVKVYIYDVSKGMARAMSQPLLGKHLDGIWHTGIVVYGQEFYFGGLGGIESCSPGGTVLGQPDKICDLGGTQVPFEMFMDYLGGLAQNDYRPERYHLLDHNCNTFSAELAQFLCGKSIPTYVTDLPAEVLSTPMGQMIRQFIDAVNVQPSGGHTLFPAASGPPPAKPATAGATAQKQPTTAAVGSGTMSTLNKSTSDQSLPPVVYKESLYHEKAFKEQTSEDAGLRDELLEYVSNENCSWSLGPGHLDLIGRKMQDAKVEDDVKTYICQLLQRLVLKEDFIMLLKHDRNNTIWGILNEATHYAEAVQISLAKMMANCASQSPGHCMLLEDKQSGFGTSHIKLSVEFCVSSLLSSYPSVGIIGATLVFNISRYKVPEDVIVELGSALLQYLEKPVTEEPAFHCLHTLQKFMKENSELCALASVLGTDWSKLSGLSTRVTDLAENIQKLTFDSMIA